MSAATLDPEDVTTSIAGAVLAELWISFVALTRSHLGALQTTGRLAKATLTEADDNSFTVRDLSRSMTLAISLEDGRGTYRVERMGAVLDKGAWMLRADATVLMDSEGPQDMELAIEALARKLWSTPLEGVAL